MDDCRCCDNFSGDVSAGNMGRKTEGGRKKVASKTAGRATDGRRKQHSKKNGTTAEKK